MTPGSDVVLGLQGVTVMRSGNVLLDAVDWQVRGGERWVLLGANGSGKTTLVSVAATYIWPSRGSVSVLGQQLGAVDVRELRKQIGIVSASLEARIPQGLTALDVAVAGATGAIAPWWDRQTQATMDRAAERLELVGCGAIAERGFDLLSSGERQRVQIARALMLDPALLLLDEPAAGLDLGAREQLAALLARLNADGALAATVVVTHHVEEIAAGTTHAIVLKSGRVIAAGPVIDTVTGPVLSEAFGLPLRVERVGARFTAQAA
ncbi:MAG TPA: ATP-binding cassette domain-containing protein [Candidatus Limnocylindrales bacterium]